jgi:hypothetical protein
MMQAARKLSLCFASLLGFGLLAGAAEAKRAEYEINGTTYTYSTKNRAQVELARRRIEAANRAAEIKARAAAEVASNPLVRLFGSRIQAEVPAAEAELKTTFLSDGSVREDPVDREAYMMSFVEQLRRKTSSDPISRRLREP